MQVRIQSTPNAQADQQRRRSLRNLRCGQLLLCNFTHQTRRRRQNKRVQGEKRLDSARLSSARRMRVCYFRSPDYFGCGRLVPAEGNAECPLARCTLRMRRAATTLAGSGISAVTSVFGLSESPGLGLALALALALASPLPPSTRSRSSLASLSPSFFLGRWYSVAHSDIAPRSLHRAKLSRSSSKR